MRGIEASAFNAPIDVLFSVAKQQAIGATTISIGDGGNEIGMGNIYEFVKRHVPRGETIGCRVTTDHLLTAGVSNWGGYALACALYILATESDPKNANKRMLPDATVESEILDVMLAHGAVDGPTCTAARKVDSFDWDYHAALLEKMIALCTKAK